ncbi:hypothetical protein FACS1894162_4360 [Bacteroidia bacterium]|nr:hypothetical protein FACS1894162_4360 [Bacteroidia bacterium]
MVGKWERTGGSGYSDNGGQHFFIGADRIEFLKDGKALYQMYGWFGEFDSKRKYIYRWGDVKNATWEVSDNRLFMYSNNDGNNTYDYKISGSELELRQTKYGSEQYTTYKKQ